MRFKNNPANIRYMEANHWIGLAGNDNGFCTFYNLKYGLRALVVLLRGYIKRGYDSPYKIISRYAPHIENPTSSYIRFVCAYVGCTSYHKISYRSKEFLNLCSAICYFESNTNIQEREVMEVIDMFNL